ncbi:MAG: GntR family transcriptional regulator [Oscillospiraceae bacterium]|nr:GntR family transcriptional regulator [Oscillospiraceae bacterium]
MQHKTISLADQVFERLESDILTGVYPRGSILTEHSLSVDLGVSRTPLNEALSRLEQEHIVESTARGVIVLSITPEDALIIDRIRLLLEGPVARRCAELITDKQIDELREILELQEFYIKKQDTEHINLIDSQFHRQIYVCAGSHVYEDTLLPLLKKIQKFRQAVLSVGTRAEDSCQEHRRIYEAIAARDPESVECAMWRHVRRSKEQLEEFIKNNGG